jgi:hypothetical protein
MRNWLFIGHPNAGWRSAGRWLSYFIKQLSQVGPLKPPVASANRNPSEKHGL